MVLFKSLNIYVYIYFETFDFEEKTNSDSKL